MRSRSDGESQLQNRSVRLVRAKVGRPVDGRGAIAEIAQSTPAVRGADADAVVRDAQARSLARGGHLHLDVGRLRVPDDVGQRLPERGQELWPDLIRYDRFHGPDVR